MAPPPPLYRDVAREHGDKEYIDRVWKQRVEPALMELIRQRATIDDLLDVTGTEPQAWCRDNASSFDVKYCRDDDDANYKVLETSGLLRWQADCIDAQVLVVSESNVTQFLRWCPDTVVAKESVVALVRELGLIFIGRYHEGNVITFHPHITGETVALPRFESYRANVDHHYRYWLTALPFDSDSTRRSHPVRLFPSDLRYETGIGTRGPLTAIRKARSAAGMRFGKWNGGEWPRGHMSPFTAHVDDQVLVKMSKRGDAMITIRHVVRDADWQPLFANRERVDSRSIDWAVVRRSPIIKYMIDDTRMTSAFPSLLGIFIAEYMPADALSNPHTLRTFQSVAIAGTAHVLGLDTSYVYDHVTKDDWSDHELRVRLTIDQSGILNDSDVVPIEAADQFRRNAWSICTMDDYRVGTGRFVRLNGNELWFDNNPRWRMFIAAHGLGGFAFTRDDDDIYRSESTHNGGIELVTGEPTTELEDMSGPVTVNERIRRAVVDAIMNDSAIDIDSLTNQEIADAVSMMYTNNEPKMDFIRRFLTRASPGDLYDELYNMTPSAPGGFELDRYFFKVLRRIIIDWTGGIQIDFIDIPYNTMERMISESLKPRVAPTAAHVPRRP